MLKKQTGMSLCMHVEDLSLGETLALKYLSYSAENEMSLASHISEKLEHRDYAIYDLFQKEMVNARLSAIPKVFAQ